MNTTRAMNTKWGEDRIHIAVHVDKHRHERLQAVVEEYARKVGRPVSLSLLIHRALDLLDARLAELDDPADIITERLALLGPARHPLRLKGDHQHET